MQFVVKIKIIYRGDKLMISRKDLREGQLYLFLNGRDYVAAEFTGKYDEQGRAIMKYKHEIFYVNVGD